MDSGLSLTGLAVAQWAKNCGFQSANHGHGSVGCGIHTE